MNKHLIIIIFTVVLINISTGYSSDFGKLYLKEKNNNTILLSTGLGTTILEKSFVISTNIIFRIEKNIDVLTGIDYYFCSASFLNTFENSFAFNFVPYFRIKISKNTNLRLGFGVSYYRKSIVPMFSLKFDFMFTHNNYIGIEAKSYIAVSPEEFPTGIILLNYSIKF